MLLASVKFSATANPFLSLPKIVPIPCVRGIATAAALLSSTIEPVNTVVSGSGHLRFAVRTGFVGKHLYLGKVLATGTHARKKFTRSDTRGWSPGPTLPLFPQTRMSELQQQQQHDAKRKRSNDSREMSSPTGTGSMGVDIRVPSDWQVESQVVKGKKCIGTHSGIFHCDEALSCAMLKCLPEWSDAIVVRTRDDKELAKCDVVVDVGGVYDPATLRFDHHQKTFHDTLSEEAFCTRLSSAGLIYRHFGKDVLKKLVEGSSIPSDIVDAKFYGKVYKNFIEHIDAIDNGVDMADTPVKYYISTHLSSRVASLNPKWNAAPDSAGSNEVNELFKKAMSLAGGELSSYVHELSTSWWAARAIVAESLAKRHDVHPSGEIMVLGGYCPWISHLFELEEEMGVVGQLKYVLYEANLGENWRIQAVPRSQDSFALRLSLPQAWLGLRDEELSQASGIAGCVFVHANGFIGGNANKTGAVAMASKTLEMKTTEK